MDGLPPGKISFGPEANCDLDTCPLMYSVFTYRPSLPANVLFLIIFAIIGIVHGYLGWRWKSWGFMVCMLLGCTFEIIGYVGRIMMWQNPFDFYGFLIQITFLSTAPVFFTASIYVTLSKTIIHFAPDLSRFKPQFFYWFFIPADIICLILQGAGGIVSTISDGDKKVEDIGVGASMAGLVLQVVLLVAFVGAFGDFMFRYWRSGRLGSLGWRLVSFFTGLSVSIVLILIRCCYRVAELKDGYEGEMMKHEAPFIALEGGFIVVAAVALCWGHPGLVFDREDKHKSLSSQSEETNLAVEMR